MIEHINKSFPQSLSNKCLEISNSKSIQVYDDRVKNRCIIHKEAWKLKFPYFTIENPTEKDISIWSIDNCVLFECDGKKCDFATFDNKRFYFIEIKKGSGEYGSKSKSSAIHQLRKSLEYFLPRLPLEKHTVFACACVGYFITRPAASASNLDLMVEFISNYNVELIEGNKVVFN